MNEDKKGFEHLKPVYQHIIDRGYFDGQAVYMITGEEPSETTYFATNEARKLVRELTPGEKRGGLAEKFKELMGKYHIAAELEVEPPDKKNKTLEPLAISLRGHEKGAEKDFSVCGDGDIDDGLADTMEIQGPLSMASRNYLRRVAKEMRDTDVAIGRAIENGNSEQAEFLSNQWDSQRGKLLVYLKKSKIRVCPMRKKDKEKIIDKAEAVEYKQEKNKGIEKPKTRGHSRELTRTKQNS